MKNQTLIVICRLEYHYGQSSIYVQEPKNNKDSELINIVQELIQNHIHERYDNVHKNKVNCNKKFVKAHRLTKSKICIHDILSKDYQTILFDVLHLLASNGYKLTIEQDFFWT
jgi:monomeric isocitrate dehydrogenase